MTIISVVNAAENEGLAGRIREDLAAAGYDLADSVPSGREGLLVVVLAPGALPEVEPAIYAALDQHQHVIPVLARSMPLPPYIVNLNPLDFSSGYKSDLLLREVKRLTAPGTPPPLTVLTPARRTANRRTALFLGIPIVVMFLAAIIGIMLNITLPPEDEFDSLATRDYEMRNYEIDRTLPRTTEDAASFPATLDHFVQPEVRAVIEATVTGIAGYSESTWLPRSTEDAAEFEATLEQVSTLVQERMAATATEMAASGATPEGG